MVCTVLIKFRLAEPDAIKETQEALAELIECVRTREPEMLTYVAYQQADDPLRFYQYMEFLDEHAYERHATSAHLRRFVATVAPFCSEEPDCIRLTQLCRADPA